MVSWPLRQTGEGVTGTLSFCAFFWIADRLSASIRTGSHLEDSTSVPPTGGPGR
jgi:hypothetical protein